MLPPRPWHLSKLERSLPKLSFYLLKPLSLAGHKIREAHLVTTLLCELILGAFGFLPAFPAVAFSPKKSLRSSGVRLSIKSRQSRFLFFKILQI